MRFTDSEERKEASPDFEPFSFTYKGGALEEDGEFLACVQEEHLKFKGQKSAKLTSVYAEMSH